MKFFTILAVAVAAVSAVAIPEADRRSILPVSSLTPVLTTRLADSCQRVGRACSKSKRIAEAFLKAEARDSCQRVGRACSKAKRAAEAFNEARDSCQRVGRPCSKAKRAAEEVLELAARSAEPDVNSELDRRCYMPGQPCYVAERELDEAAKIARDILDLHHELE